MSRWHRRARRRGHPGLMRLDDALQALGRDGEISRRTGDVRIAAIVGSEGRPFDFDHEFRPLTKQLQPRWQRLFDAVDSGLEPPPVDLVQLGELYFVRDGHHRISVAKALGREWITARVHRICTIAYAQACLQAAHLPNKAAERRFLERIPLPNALRTQLWLDEPAQWARLIDAAEAWALRRTLSGDGPTDRCELAATWWTDEVEPVIATLRAAGIGTDLRDVQLYVTALAIRDQLGPPSWPADLDHHLGPQHTAS